jgi:hypothetical protein
MARENIPGFSVFIKDGGLATVLVDGDLTDNVLVIGMAMDGPVGEIQRINANSAEAIFGPIAYNDYYTSSLGASKKNSYNGNSLVKGMNEVLMGGATNISLLRVGGTKATSTVGNLVFEGYYPGAIYNGVTVAFTSGAAPTITITQTAINKGNNITYNIAGLTLADIITTINVDPYNKSVRLSALTSSTLTTAAPTGTQGTFTLTGGTNGTMFDTMTASAFAAAVSDPTTGAFTVLQDSDADIIFLSGVYADQDTSTGQTGIGSIATALASACFLGSINSFPKIGVVGLSPVYTADRTGVASKVSSLITSSSGFYDAGRKMTNFGYFISASATGGSQFTATDPRTNATVDTGRYIQVVAGPDVFLTQAGLKTYAENPAGCYAGFIAGLAPQRATTNKALPGIQGLIWEYTTNQVSLLAGGQPAVAGTPPTFGNGGAYVVLRHNNLGNIVVNLDNTAAIRTSDYNKLQVLRIVNAVVEGIRRIGTPYIGEPNSLAARLGLRNQIRNFLDAVADSGAIAGVEGTGYQFKVYATATDILRGILRVELTLRPALQVTSINVSITLSAPAGD